MCVCVYMCRFAFSIYPLGPSGSEGKCAGKDDSWLSTSLLLLCTVVKFFLDLSSL